MTDLDRLIEVWEAGTDTAHHHAAAFPSESAYGHCTWHDSHKASTGGDMNAALALHKALVPGWFWMQTPAMRIRLEGPRVSDGSIVRVWGPNDGDTGVTASAADPARALGLAVLKAHRAQLAAGVKP